MSLGANLRQDGKLKYWTASNGQSWVELTSACTFDAVNWQGLPMPCTEASADTFNHMKLWSLRFDGHPINGQVEALHEPGQFGLLISRLNLETDHLVRMNFDEEVIQMSFMLRPNLYTIEKLGDQCLPCSHFGEPSCLVLHFMKGQEIIWRSRAAAGSTKVDMFLPARSLKRFYDIGTTHFPLPLRKMVSGEPSFMLLSLPLTAEIRDCLDQMLNMHRISRIRGAFLRGKVHNLMSAIWFAAERFERTVHQPFNTKSRDEFLVSKARRHINDNLASELTLQSIAHVVGTNRNKLNFVFQACLGETVFKHLQRTRLEHAMSALASGNCRSVTDVARTVGYSDSTSFARAFEARFGSLPSDIIRRGTP